MSSIEENTKLFIRRKDETSSLYEYYARANGLQGKSMLILIWIYYNPNGISQNFIAQKTYSTKQVVNATVKSFSQKGYIEYIEDEEDKRFKKIKLTDEGKEYAAKILDPLEEAENHAMSSLSDEQQKQFIEYMTLFNKGLKENIEQLTTEKRGK